jgi:tetratricopeptide (TPR) repeat protein
MVSCLVATSSGLAAEDAPSPLETTAPLTAPEGEQTVEPLSADDQPDAAKRQIQQLIRQLGDTHFATRRAAAAELRQIGAEAFDQLHEATTDSDLEIAASARYLLRRISVRWMQSTDSPAVRNLLRDYDRQPDNVRLRRVDDLSDLANGEGVAGLCRIARFDRSPIVSRMAALAIIRPEEEADSPSRIDPAVVERELGGSSRVAAEWLRRYLVQRRDPAAAVAYWQKLVDEEVAQLEQNAADTSPQIVSGLLWNLSELQRQLDNRPAIFDVVDRMVEVDPDAMEATSIALLTWINKHQLWDVLERFLAKYQAQLEQSKRPLYHAAIARAKQGNAEQAEQMAEKAAQMDSQTSLESFFAAKELEEHNQFDWAVREYRNSIDDEKIATQEGILARVSLASLLHDYEHYQKAAEAIEPLAKAVKNEGEVGKLYAELYRYYGGRMNLHAPSAVSAKLHFYRACQHHVDQDWKREQEELELAIKFDPTDADIVIAMYRLPEADEAWREKTRQCIQDLSRKLQQEIDEKPGDPSAYNQWAWLVSNTEGDFQKAIRYSHRSLELIPTGAGKSLGGSFLDTLGRCYFAAGDVENALKYQREAIKKVDYMQVMHRQLAQFEQAYAQKQAAGGKKQGTEGSN